MADQRLVLLVVDAPLGAEHIRHAITQVAPDRTVQVIESTADAMAALESGEVEVVFAGLTAGADKTLAFLNEVWQRKPRTVRYLLAASASSDVIVNCSVGSHHFLSLPASESAIAEALARADVVNRLIRSEGLQSLVSRMRTLPSRPSLYIEVMRELRSPNASASTVGALVAKDLAISTKLIQVVNSAFYGLNQEVTDPAAAVLLLGLETTTSLILSIEALAKFDKVKPLYFSMDRVWKHSQAVAHSSKRIAEHMSNNPDMPGHAYTAGLLHDIGKLALALNFEDQYNGALKLAETQGISACEVEKQVFGATHAEAGAYLLSTWGLPLPIVEAVAEHHDPAHSLRPPFSAATALHLAEALEGEAVSRGSGAKPPEIDLDYAEELEIVQRIPELRQLVRGETGPEESSSGKSSRKRAASQDLAGRSNPLPASGEPAPVLHLESKPPLKKPQVPVATIAIVSLVALACAGSFLFRSSKPAATVPPSSAQAPPSATAAAGPAPAPKAQTPVPLPAPAQSAASRLNLQAIIYNGAKSSLVINGQSFHLGDEVEGARIVAVDRSAITIEKQGERQLVQLLPP